ncbi:MAG: NADPH-dependent FMN reductase, partial [Candidatus Nanohalobium sp.]
GILKTALDYLYSEYEDKPFAFVTVSGGGFGGIRALNHLHDVVIEFGGFIGPNLPVSRVGSVFDDEGNLQDEDYVERFQRFVSDCEDFREKLENGIE